jgi:hypothetical protein
LFLLAFYLYVSMINSFFLADIIIYFRSISSSIVATSPFVTIIIVGYTTAILVIIILMIHKENLGLDRVRVFFLLGYDRKL